MLLDEPEPEHKKTTFPYSTYEFVQLPDEIEETEKRTDDDFTNLQSKFNKVNDVATEQKKQKEIEDVIKTVIKDPLPNNDFWWEEEVFNKNDSPPTVDATKIIVHDIKEKNDDALKNIDIQAISDNILKNLQPVHNRNIQEIIDDDFIPIGDTTQQQLEDNYFFSLADENESEIEVDTPSESEIEVDTADPEIVEIDTTSAWDHNKTDIAKPGPIVKLSTEYDRKLKAGKKIKNKDLK